MSTLQFEDKKFFMVEKSIFQQKGLKKTDKMTYIYLSAICKDMPEHLSFARLKTLQNYFGVTRPTFKQVIKRLEEARIVQNQGENVMKLLTRENLNVKGNFFFLHYSILYSDKITPRQKLIYAFILSRASNDNMVSQLSAATIAQKCAIRDDIRLREDIAFLSLIGLISTKKQKKKYNGEELQFDKTKYFLLKIPDLL